jgi:hypothetical protein
MRGILEFGLETEREEFEMAQNGWKYKSALEQFYNDGLRSRIKHNLGKPTKKELELLDKLRDEFFEILNNYGVEIL